MKRDRKYQPAKRLALLAMAVLALFACTDASAQGQRSETRGYSGDSTAVEGRLWAGKVDLLPSNSTSRDGFASAHRPTEGWLLFDASNGSPIDPFNWRAEEKPMTWVEVEGGRYVLFVPSAEQSRAMSPRATRTFPHQATAAMGRNSGLGGPFERIYPRHFPGGGQP